MTFNSIDFIVFFPIVFFLYWFVLKNSAKYQNILLLISSVFFYCWADWRFLFLILANAFFNFFIGVKIADSTKEKSQQGFFWLGIAFNVGVLGYFKYFNFFYDGFADLFNLFGANLNHSSLHLILPLGISFFTFQTLGYIIDIYNGETKPCRDPLIFLTYVTYFPKIISGPIERAQRFIPQIEKKRIFDFSLAKNGLQQILWGLFAKVVIADNCATMVNEIFANYEVKTGSILLIGSYLYIVQIYCDFSGYSNIAIGVSKLLGIKLMMNFATPFFSTNISEYWKKWHISLTSWMMDYVFTPLSFLLRRYRNAGLLISIITTFIIVGLWHGANWTFIIFGLLQGIYFIPLVLRGTLNKSSVNMNDKKYPSLGELLKMMGLFTLMMLTAIFFRADNVSQAFQYISQIFSLSLFDKPDLKAFIFIIPVIILFFIFEWMNRDKEHALEFNSNKTYVKWSLYIILGFVIILSYNDNPNTFIYLQF